MRAIALSLALLLAGCGGHSNVQFASSALPPGGVSTGGSVQAQSQSTLAVLIAIGVLMGVSYASGRQEESLGPRSGQSSSGFGTSSTEVPGMDRTRRVIESDCTKPIEDRSANLKCK
jgi:hypothetical protein